MDTGHEESYFGEINSFLIDRILGFFHTPAVIPRAFLSSKLLEFADHAEVKIISILFLFKFIFPFRKGQNMITMENLLEKLQVL